MPEIRGLTLDLAFAGARNTGAGRQHFTLEDPALHANGPVGGAGLGEAVLDVGAQGVQWNATFAVPLVARHLCATEAARGGNADSLGAELHGGLNGLLHGTAEGDATLKLGRDVLRDELGVGLGLT